MSSNIKQVIFWIVGALAFLGIIIWISVATTPQGPGKIASENDTKPTAQDWIKGKLDAKVQVMEYSDLQCPACSAYQPILDRLISEYGDKIGFTYRHYPLFTAHKNAMRASWASEAAGVQGKFWEMHDKLFDTQKEWSDDEDPTAKFVEYAKGLNLNADTFKVDMSSSIVQSKVQGQTDAGDRAGVNSTPTLFLNGKKLDPLPRSYDELKNLVQKELDK